MQTERATQALLGIIVFLSLCIWLALQEGSAECEPSTPEACRVQAEAGDADAQETLGLMYDDGEGVPEDDAEAVRWYRMAARQGHTSAQSRLANIVQIWHRRAEQGDADAQYSLGYMYVTGYSSGRAVPFERAESRRWYRMAAEQGDTFAQHSLGNMLRENDGGSGESDWPRPARSDAEAARWYRMAAEAGDRRSQYSLGFMYANGEGVVQNDARAYFCFTLADFADSPTLDNAIPLRVAARLSHADLAAVQRLATQCQESGFEDCGEPED